MKKAVLISLIMLLVLPALAFGLTNGNKSNTPYGNSTLPEGWKGIPWGASPNEFGDSIFIVMKLGKVEVYAENWPYNSTIGVFLLFYQNQFKCLAFYCKNIKIFAEMMDQFKRYGKPQVMLVKNKIRFVWENGTNVIIATPDDLTVLIGTLKGIADIGQEIEGKIGKQSL